MAKRQMNLTDETLSPVRVILFLTWPLFLEQILTTLVSYADTAMVGALGVSATASVSISNSFIPVLFFSACPLAPLTDERSITKIITGINNVVKTA